MACLDGQVLAERLMSATSKASEKATESDEPGLRLISDAGLRNIARCSLTGRHPAF